MASPLDKHLALIGFMGAGKSRLGKRVAPLLGRRFVDLDREIERVTGRSIPDIFRDEGESSFRTLEADAALRELESPEPAVIAVGGGAVETEAILDKLRERAITALVNIDPDEAWRRVRDSGRPLASDESSFRALYERREEDYLFASDVVVEDADDAVLAAGRISLGGTGEAFIGSEVIADENVLRLHALEGDAPVHTVPAGEAAKTLQQAERLWRELQIGRSGLVFGIGGGSTTDLTGFVAATYMRGINWIAMPTTLVGQVDAAIGGKTAINLPEGKNLVGAFHWPMRTMIDTAYLETLPKEEWSNGMAEVVKTGLLAGEALWELPEDELVRRTAAFKAAVCIRDPYEYGERRMLNLGHTFAHALEAASDYDVAHGQAVALGLMAALRISGLPTDTVEEVLSPKPVRVDRERAWAALARDKKSVGGRPRLVVLDKPGDPRIDVEVPEADVRRALDELIYY